MTRDQLEQVEADLWSAANNLHANEAGILILGRRQVLRSKLHSKLWK
jgi:hypothetical protein